MTAHYAATPMFAICSTADVLCLTCCVMRVGLLPLNGQLLCARADHSAL